MCLPCKQYVILSAQGEKYRKILLILLIIGIILLVLRIVFNISTSIFTSVIEILMLLGAYTMTHYVYCAYLTFFVLFDALYTVFFIIQRIQNKALHLHDKYLDEKFYKVAVYIQILFFIYCGFLIYFAFVSYREFKACAKGEINYRPLSGNNNNNNNEDNNRDNDYNEQYEEPSPEPTNNKGFIPFSGKGYAVGGD